MPKRQKLTNSSDETEIGSLLSGDTVFAVPYFQRAYKWKPERLKQLNDDLLSLVDGSSDSHFFGAVIIHGRRSNPSDPDVYEVIDGQQRITTVFLYLCAIVRVLCKHQQYEEAIGLFQKYLVIVRDTSLTTNSKLQSCKDDRAQLNKVLNDLMEDVTFAERVSPFRYKPMRAVGTERGRLWNNYRSALRFFDDQVKKETVERLRALYGALLDSISVVQIDVWDPTNGPKIFDSLNSQQEPMTTGDLVRNEIFSRIADEDPDKVDEIDERSWRPFYGKFRTDNGNLFDNYFFPYGLIEDPNIRKSEVYAKLREKWLSIRDPELIVKDLSQFQNAFLDLACGTNLQEHPPEIAEVFCDLFESDLPASTYPFLMRFSNAIRSGQVSISSGRAVLTIVESFLVRRAICGHEPTGLHAVFKRLWSACQGNVSPDRVESEIRERKTVVWPSDTDVRNAVFTRALYGSSITPFVLMEWNRSLKGDQPNFKPWVEHVLPDRPCDEWFQIFTKPQHEEMKDVLANLLPLSQQMNQNLSNAPYAQKRPKYREDAGFKATRQFAEEFSEWTPDLLEKRSEKLAGWCVSRWPN